jgi:hypothetical protein
MQACSPLISLSLVLLAAGFACKSRPLAGPALFADTFDRADLGSDWLDTSHAAKIVDGKLTLGVAHNHPVWLRRELPRDVQVDFDVASKGPAGDIKVELFGDGKSFASDVQGLYQPTGYEIVMGGWNNSRSIIGRLGEHGDTVKVSRERLGTDPIVTPGRTYHFTITRRGSILDWKINGAPYLAWTDPQPVWGQGHEYFAFNAWEVETSFDNLTIGPAQVP